MTTGFIAAKVNGFLNAIRTGGTSLTAVTTVYVQLHTGDPGAAATSNVSAGSTTRVALSQTAASGGSMSITGTNPQWTNGGTSETVSHASGWDAPTGGSPIWTSQLASSKSWASGDTLTLNTATISVTPIAA